MLTVLPGTLRREVLTERLAGADAAAVMKIGRSYEGPGAALRPGGSTRRATSSAPPAASSVIERAGGCRPRLGPYLSLVILPARRRRRHAGGGARTRARGGNRRRARPGGWTSSGLGPAGRTG